jgi:hypothetical protein
MEAIHLLRYSRHGSGVRLYTLEPEGHSASASEVAVRYRVLHQRATLPLPSLRRYVQANKLLPCHTVGRNQMFSAEDLRAYKRARR